MLIINNPSNRSLVKNLLISEPPIQTDNHDLWDPDYQNMDYEKRKKFNIDFNDSLCILESDNIASLNKFNFDNTNLDKVFLEDLNK